MERYETDDLRRKLIVMYPEIGVKGVALSINYDKAKRSWIMKLAKDGKEETILLPEADADACMREEVCQPFKTELQDALNRFEGR